MKILVRIFWYMVAKNFSNFHTGVYDPPPRGVTKIFLGSTWEGVILMNQFLDH